MYLKRKIRKFFACRLGSGVCLLESDNVVDGLYQQKLQQQQKTDVHIWLKLLFSCVIDEINEN